MSRGIFSKQNHCKLGFQIQIEQFIETVNYITVFIHALYRKILHYTAQKMKFSIKDFFVFCAVLALKT